MNALQLVATLKGFPDQTFRFIAIDDTKKLLQIMNCGVFGPSFNVRIEDYGPAEEGDMPQIVEAPDALPR